MARVWHELGATLAGLPEHEPRLAVIDFAGLVASETVPVRDERLYRFGDLPYTDAALALLAAEARRVIQADAGLSRKVLALDLDNTLWGGVLGEVGARDVALGGLYPGNCYAEVQRTAAALRRQGVVLVLASKNDPEPVERALREHPEVVLRPDAFSVMAVNWEPKATNLRAAAEGLGLDVSSFVFLDDSSFECGHVAAELPEVAVVSAGGDPAAITARLLRGGWFDIPALTATDRDRPELYRTRALRHDFASAFGSSEDYLGALEIHLSATPVDEFSVGRVAQLAARTNQFNVGGRRFDAATTAAMADDPGHLVVSFAVRDRFGDEGIVGAAWVHCTTERWCVLDFVLSCRVLGRGVELAAVGWVVERARAAGVDLVEGVFAPSGRNGVAADLWHRAGFSPTDTEGLFRVDTRHIASATPWITIDGGVPAVAV